jgi:hypothetical protein
MVCWYVSISLLYIQINAPSQIYRCYVFWKESLLGPLLPAIIYLGSTGLSLAFLIISSSDSLGLDSKTVQSLALAYWASSMGLNILVALMISARLFHYRSRMKQVLGKEHARYFLSVSAMLVESAALYAACSLATLLAYALGSGLLLVCIPVQGMIQVCSSPCFPSPRH